MSEGPQIDVDYAATPLYEKVVGPEAAAAADKVFNTPTSARHTVVADDTIPADPRGRAMQALAMVFVAAFFLGGLTVYVLIKY